MSIDASLINLVASFTNIIASEYVSCDSFIDTCATVIENREFLCEYIASMEKL